MARGRLLRLEALLDENGAETGRGSQAWDAPADAGPGHANDAQRDESVCRDEDAVDGAVLRWTAQGVADGVAAESGG